MKKADFMRFNLPRPVIVPILLICLLFFPGSSSAIEKLAEDAIKWQTAGEFVNFKLVSLQKHPGLVKTPAQRNALATVPGMKKLVEPEMEWETVGEFVRFKLFSLQKHPGPVKTLSERIAEGALPRLRRMADSEMGEITAGELYNYYGLLDKQPTIIDEAGVWVKIKAEIYTDVHAEPKVPWLDVKPYTWFLIDRSVVNHPNYNLWWDHYKEDYGKYWRDLEFDVSDTFYSKGVRRNVHNPDYDFDAIFKNRDGKILKYKTHVLEMTYRPEIYEYENIKLTTQGGMLYRARVGSTEIRRGYVIFFE